MAASFEMAEEEIEAPRSTGAEAAVTPDSSYRSIERATEDDETVGGMFWFATTHRIGSCCGLCGVNALFIIVTLVLGGLGLQPMSTDKLGEVGLTLIEDRYQRRANAYAKGALEASFDLVTARCPRSIAADPIILILMKGSFDDEGGNALTTEGLSELRKREERITSHAGWGERCKLSYATAYPTCDLNKTATMKTADGSGTEYKISDGNGCQRPFSPVFFFEKYGDPNFVDIVGTVAKIEAAGTADWTSFKDMLHKDFTSQNLNSKILQTAIYAGTPRHDVSHYTQPEVAYLIEELGLPIEYYTQNYREDERTHLNHWIVEEFEEDFFEDQQDKRFPTLYFYALYNPLMDQVQVDLNLIMMSIVIVCCYMWFYLGSAFVMTAGMFQIFCSFFGANLLYRYFWPTAFGFGYRYFTIFCALSLFIIMGIGADDIFVYWDVWQASAAGGGHGIYKTDAHRLRHVYYHAAGAMLVTSATTVISFITNLASPFPGIATFGVFAALLVLVNFCAVVSYFPCVVLFYEHHVKHLPSPWQALVDTVCSTKKKVAPDGGSVAEGGGGLPVWFCNVYAPFLCKYRFAVLGALGSWWFLFLIFACMIEAVPFQLYELLPADTNFHQVTYVNNFWFPPSAKPLTAHILFGFDHKNPLGTNDLRPERFVAGESGLVNWDTGFDLDGVEAQIQLYSIADMLAHTPPDGLKVDRTHGINTQIEGSRMGSFMDTADGGVSSAFQKAYGVQSLFHSMASWENMSARIDPNASRYATEHVPGRTCVPCFSTFMISPDLFDIDKTTGVDKKTGIVVSELTLDATSPLVDGCTCSGFWPIPTRVCLNETKSVADATLFKCSRSEDQVAYEIAALVGSHPADSSWWKAYIFALGDSRGAYLRLAFYDIAVQTTLRASESDYVAGLKMAKKWDDWMDSLNGRYSMAGNYLMAIIATTTIGMITTIVLGFMHVVGWGLGTLESILIVVVIGFSVDYTVHLADSYLSSEHDSREAKVKAALADTGASILSGAISTLGASCPMFGAQIIFFFKFAVFIFLTVALSLIFSLGFFAAALATLGPLGEQGSVAKVYTALEKSNTANIRKIEEEQSMPRKPERLVRPVEELREIVLVLHEAFASVCGSEGTRSTMRGNWQRLFESIDEDQSGRLSFKEFRLAAKLLVRDALDFDALTALWDYIDYNGSGESTIKEFQQATYLLMLDDWEDLLTEEHAGELQGVVAQLEEAVETRHTRKKFHDTTGGTVKEAPGNWYKVFALFDITGSGLLGYEELEEVIRADYPGLGMKPAAISTNRIRGLWKAIDADRSGDVTVKEFVSFMRRHGPRMTRLMAFSQHSQVLVPEGAGATATVREPLGRESLAAKFGYEPATLDGGGDDDLERHQGSHIAR
ncbi:hypothetical protein SO694_00108036 [Aureococcus anophagefferens]|uniref:Calmodulin n=1 Tax=Aureococcus anophagefferens TaxID=44056 RepID=A0ABR1FM67_AURAN